MDWKGRFAKAYQFEKEASNILIFNRNKKLVFKVGVRELDWQQLGVIVGKLRELLEEQGND